MIRGSTKLIAMLGSPLNRVRAPALFNAHFEKNGADAVMIPLEVIADYPALFRELFKVPNVAGAMITFPYKRCIDVMGEVSPRSVVAQACNVVVKRADGTVYGDIFDGEGFANGVKRAGFQFAGARCLVVGSGGAGAAIAAAFIDFGAAFVGVASRNKPACAAVAERLDRYATGRCRTEMVSGDPAGFDLVVNATPLGMNDSDPFSFDIDHVEPGAMVADLVMGQETALLRAAAARGCRIQPGTKMLFEQLSPVSEFWGYPGASFDGVLALIKALGWKA
jgi:shikimate dehydrogenase